jgi:penicillin-binding protein 1C
MEWFIQGTQQPRFAMQASAPGTAARITAPTNGSIIALDPDIPVTRQRLSFQAEGSGLRWMVDGKDFARGNGAQWMPWPGRHVVSLLNAKSETLDAVRIEVRGAGVVKVVGQR